MGRATTEQPSALLCLPTAAPEHLVAFTHSEQPEQHGMYVDLANAMVNLLLLETFPQTLGGFVPSYEWIWTVVPPALVTNTGQWVGWTPSGPIQNPMFAQVPHPTDSPSIHITLRHSTSVFKLSTCLVYWIKAWVSMPMSLHRRNTFSGTCFVQNS